MSDYNLSTTFELTAAMHLSIDAAQFLSHFDCLFFRSGLCLEGLTSRLETPLDSLIPVSNSEDSIGKEKEVNSFDNYCRYRWLDFGQASLNSFNSPFTKG